jgi:hypothetical protein
MSSRPSDAYKAAVDHAALMLLAALRDHAKPQFSAVQLEALRLRGGVAKEGSGSGRKNAHAVFADIRIRATDLLSAELKRSGVAQDVGAEVDRILHRLLISVEQMFVER